MTDKFKALRDATQAVVQWGSSDRYWAHTDEDKRADGIFVVGAIIEGEPYELLEIDADTYGTDSESEKLARFYATANPNTIRALLAEVEALRQDKARLDWLEQWARDTNRVTIGTDDLPPHQLFITSDCDPTTWSMTDLRDAIDAALRAKEESRG